MIREKLKAQFELYQDVMQPSDTLRCKLSSEQAIALLDELDGVTLNHPERVTVAKAALAAVGEAAGGIEGQLAHAKRLEAAINLLWEALEGQAVDGVTITRKQA